MTREELSGALDELAVGGGTRNFVEYMARKKAILDAFDAARAEVPKAFVEQVRATYRALTDAFTTANARSADAVLRACAALGNLTAAQDAVIEPSDEPAPKGQIHHVDYGRPGVDVLSTPVQLVDTRHVGKMMTAALESRSKNKSRTP